jgi:excinuclease ABC subunit A
VGTTTEVWHFLRLLYVKLGIQHCINDGAAVQPQTPDSIAAQLLRNFKGQHIGLLAPLVMNRKGVYTELADWARPRGFTHLRVDGDFLPTTGFPRIDRFKEHTHRAARGQPRRRAETKPNCARRSPRRSNTARAWCMC